MVPEHARLRPMDYDSTPRPQDDLQAQYRPLQKQAGQNSGTARDPAKQNWASLVRNWLTHYFHILTKGRILTDFGHVTAQVDVLVLSASHPKTLLDKKRHLAAGLVAAFECKTTLQQVPYVIHHKNKPPNHLAFRFSVIGCICLLTTCECIAS